MIGKAVNLKWKSERWAVAADKHHVAHKHGERHRNVLEHGGAAFEHNRVLRATHP
jgi:hypothetical protein